MSFLDLAKESRIHVRLRAEWEGLARSEDALVVKAVGGGYLPRVGAWVAAYESGNASLTAGAPLAELRDAMIAAAGADSAVGYLILLQKLCLWGFLDFPLVDDSGARAVVLPQWSSFVPALAPDAPAAGKSLSRYACLRREGDSWLLESPLCGCRFAFADLADLEAPLVRRALDAAGFLDDGGDDDPRATALTQWEFHDLLFHVHSRMGWHRDNLGAFFPYIDEIDPLPALRPPWPGPRIALPRAPAASGGEPFAELLERRRSERFYDETRPISLGDLGALLDRAARVRSSETVPVANFMGRTTTFEITRRPYPNGGASYELEIYPVVDRCDGLDSGLYHYDAGTHELVQLSGRTAEVEQFLSHAWSATAGQARPQIVLNIAARFARVMWKYKSISYGVILRNTGALYQTLYLAATELGLSPCGVGSGDSELFARATGLDPVVEGTVGDFLLGGPPQAS